jgi:hypothetical protein
MIPVFVYFSACQTPENSGKKGAHRNGPSAEHRKPGPILDTEVETTFRFRGSEPEAKLSPSEGQNDVQCCHDVSAQEIKETIIRAIPEIQLCRQDEPKIGKRTPLQLGVRFVIAANGSVHDARTEGSTSLDSALESCILAQFTKLQFKKTPSREDVVVSYPLNLE